MRKLLTTTLAATAALGLSVVAPPSAADGFTPAKRYVFVRVDTGDGGKQATDTEVARIAKAVKAFWDRVPNAPRFTVTVVPGVHRMEGNYPGCAFELGRKALGGLAGPRDGVVTFMPSGYACFGGGTAHGEEPGYEVEARGSARWDIIAHEIGHNFGLDHDRQVPSRWTPADFTEYANPFSIMASGVSLDSEPSAWQMAKLGWLTDSRFWPNRTRRLYPITDLDKGHTRGLSWRDGQFGYTLEYRKGTGVAIYRDGQIIERAGSVYTLKLGQVFYTSRHQGVRVIATKTYAWAERVTLP